ncbi:FliI/YscN family ATPase [bacterium]|nr:FliI/YscN family ATPase [candidate division CSSED10-310 bacterium]
MFLQGKPWQTMLTELQSTRMFHETGCLEAVNGVMLTARLNHVRIGEICTVDSQGGHLQAEVVGFRDNQCLLMPFGFTDGLHVGADVKPTGQPFCFPCGSFLKGAVLDGLGSPIEIKLKNTPHLGILASPKSTKAAYRSVHSSPPDPLRRNRITKPLLTGIAAIDACLTIGIGQRVGIFAAAGTGKSTLLGQIARTATADVIVINLIGERGREVREFIEDHLTDEGMQRSIVVAATSDQPAIIRMKSAYIATSIAEYFRDQGYHVLLIMDSVTRFARAMREMGLARGESPARSGYPPSVFAELPRLLERAGSSETGSITGIYSVLVDGDDLTEPVADEVLSILDGHIILSRQLAAENHYPAIDILQSKSRVMHYIVSSTQRQMVNELIGIYAKYINNQDALRFGLYQSGTNSELDRAVEMKPRIDDLLCTVWERTESLEVLENQLNNVLTGPGVDRTRNDAS